MKKIIILLLFIAAHKMVMAQSVGIGTITPNASAQLDVTSTTKGVLIPRMTEAEKNAIPSPAHGLMLFNTTTNSFQYYNAVSWINISHSGIISGAANKVAKFNSPWGLTAAGLISDNGAGVAINTTNAVADASALLDLTSSSKGLLAPRMTTAQRTAIASPANGLLVFDNSTASFWYYNGATWIEIITTSTSGWGLTGNAGTNPAVNFIGTTDNNDVIFKRNNTRAGLIGITNTSYGINALNPASSGINNTANGYQALYSNTTGGANTANGISALFSNLDGSSNTANGYFALSSNTTGGSNTANGAVALSSNTTGSSNTANGYQALFSNTTGIDNTANGFKALHTNIGGDKNTANGNDALYSNTFGIDNTANGNGALYSNTTGIENIANGSDALYSNTTGSSNTANGNLALYNNTSGNNNTAIGRDAGITNTTGSNLTLIGYSTDVSSNNLTNATAIGYNASVAASNAMMFGNSTITDWGFGRSSVTSGVFQVGLNASTGNGAHLTAGGVWTNASDVNLKENFTELNDDEMLKKISSLNITQWNYKNTPAPEIHIGPMAQDFKQLFGLGVAGDDKAIGTIDISGVAIAGVKGLIKKSEETEKSMQQQQAIIQNQQKQIDELKALVNKITANTVVK
jgi:hypothetical protein